jgi:hypothetical protein
MAHVDVAIVGAGPVGARLDGAGFSPPRGRAQFAGMAVLDRSVLLPDGPLCSG